MDNNYPTKKRKEDRAIGELAEGPANSVAAMEKEEATGEEGDESPVEQFSFNAADIGCLMSGNASNPSDLTKTGKKRGRLAERISKELFEMANNFRAFFENTHTRMAEIAHRIGYDQDLSQQRKLVISELLKLPMSSSQRLKATSLIVKEEYRVDLFFSLDEYDKMEWVCMLLKGSL